MAADTEEHAIDAARLIKVEYEVLPHVDGRRTGDWRARRRRSSPSGNVRQGQTQQAGDLAAGFKAAAHTLEETYATHVITHTCMESHGTVCEWDGDKLTVWISTQGINGARENFATALEHPAGERARHLPVHGRRLRQQGAERRRRRPDLRQAREGGERAGQADARSQGRASRHRQSAVGGGADQGRRLGRRHHHRVRRRVLGHGRRRARRRASRCPTSIGSRTAAARTRTSSPTPASSGRCGRRAIRRARSSPRS